MPTIDYFTRQEFDISIHIANDGDASGGECGLDVLPGFQSTSPMMVMPPPGREFYLINNISIHIANDGDAKPVVNDSHCACFISIHIANDGDALSVLEYPSMDVIFQSTSPMMVMPPPNVQNVLFSIYFNPHRQ